jgi:2,4-dienoyl-CoA reductase-like NADH-dependent reductase (Old Yellow Enzyme family)
VPTLADPLPLTHGPALRHRLALAALTNLQSNPDGTLSDDEYRWLVRRADGGMALTLTCAAYVGPGGQAWPGQLGVADDRSLPGLRRLADGIRAAGGASGVQLHHGGRRADPSLTGVQNLAPWSDPAHATRALTTAEVRRAVDDFVAAAVRAETAGFDGVEVHGAHGYLVGQFLDGRHNLRTDGYGDSLEDRSRFLFEVLTGIRSSTGAGFQLGVRLSPERYGVVLDEGRTVVGRVLTSGLVDYVDVSLWDAFKRPHEEQHRDRLLIDHFTDLPRGEARLGVAGKIVSAEGAQWCLDRGADFVLIGTGAIIHHDFAARALGDPGFRSLDQPVSREHLAGESVGPAFVDYLSTNWDDFVA